MYSKMQLTAVPGCHDSSEWLKWHALMLSRFNMTSHSQLTIANSGSSFLPPLDDGSSKWLQRCSWRAVPGRYGGSEWLKWHAFTLSGFNMTSHSQLTIANFCSSFFPHLMMDPPNDFKDAVGGLFQGAMMALNGLNDIPWRCLALIWHSILSWKLPTQAQAVYSQYIWILQMYFKMQLTSCSRVPWQLCMVEMTCLDVVSLWYDISFSVNNCLLRLKLSSSIR